MKKLIIAALLMFPATALADSATGLVAQIAIKSTATGSQGKLMVRMRTTDGDRRTMCMNGTTRMYEAYVPASNITSIALIQALLSAAMIGQHDLKVDSTWNGSYCLISNVTYGS